MPVRVKNGERKTRTELVRVDTEKSVFVCVCACVRGCVGAYVRVCARSVIELMG